MGLVKKKKEGNDNTTFKMDVSSGQMEGGCECGEKQKKYQRCGAVMFSSYAYGG